MRAGHSNRRLAGFSGRLREPPATSGGMSAGCSVVWLGNERDPRSMPSWFSSRARRQLTHARPLALGFGAPSGDAFTSATSAAISALQQVYGLTQTGTLMLGAVVIEPGVLRVTSVT